MNENLVRLLRGWRPRMDAHWFWWLVAYTPALVPIMKSAMWCKSRTCRKV